MINTYLFPRLGPLAAANHSIVIDGAKHNCLPGRAFDGLFDRDRPPPDVFFSMQTERYRYGGAAREGRTVAV